MSTPPPSVVPTAADGTWVDDWITIDAHGRVTARTGKVELGTGVLAALAQIVADELDVPYDEVEIAPVGTSDTPDEGYTAGSKSVRDGGATMRRAAAEARQVLLAEAARTLATDPGGLAVSGGVVSAPDGRTARYGDLAAGGLLHAKVTGEAPLKSPDDYRVVGTPAPRPDIPRKVLGRAGFVSDVRVPGMLHARMVRPPEFGAHLVEVDDSVLPPGVAAVRIGDLLAVVAEQEHLVVAAAEEPLATWTGGFETPGPDEVYAWMRRQRTDDVLLADDPCPDEALTATTVEFHWPFQAHASIGPSCAVADVRDGRAVVHAAAQGVHPLRVGLALLLGLPEEAVEVVHHEGSGCYGHNGADDVAADAAVLSQHLSRPVRVQWSRAEELVWARKGPATVLELTASCAADGTMRHWSSQTWTPTHGGRARTPDRFIAGHLRDGVDEPDDVRYVGGDRNVLVDYDVPQRTEMHWLRRPALPGSSLRALGATAATFANECLVDELAAAAGEDPLAYRRRHLTDPRAHAVLDAVAEASGWGRELPAGRGLGVAFGRYENTGAYLGAVAEVEVDEASGVVTVNRFWVAHDCGLVVNPDGLTNQVVGNVVQSLSRALKEEVRWEGARITTRDWETYPILRFSEVPPIEVLLLDRPDQPAVGAGEPATITTAPAVANAVAAATGARLREVPFTPDRVLAALAGRSGRGAS